MYCEKEERRRVRRTNGGREEKEVEAHLGSKRRDHDSVRDHESRHLLVDSKDLGEGDDHLRRMDGQSQLSGRRKRNETNQRTHVGNPTEDTSMEANVVLRNVESSLNEDISLESTSVVYETKPRISLNGKRDAPLLPPCSSPPSAEVLRKSTYPQSSNPPQAPP